MSRHRPQRNPNPAASQAMTSSDATSALIDAPPAEEAATTVEDRGSTVETAEPGAAPPDAAPQVPDASPQADAAPQVPCLASIMLEIPLAPANEVRYAQQHLRPLSSRQARILRRITDGLIADGATRPDGKPVANSDDALAWWLERVASAGSGR